MAFAPGLDSSAGAHSVDLPTLGIDPSSENADIFAAREPYLHELHHGMNWDAYAFRFLSFYRLRESFRPDLFQSTRAFLFLHICELHSLSLVNLVLPHASR
jgi:hypothetical protein